jgi:cytochrome bd-type quinol oxidase subunit 1
MLGASGLLALLTLTGAALAAEPAADYRPFPLLGGRLALWAAAQLHLNFAAFILGVPLFALIVEAIGWRTKDPRYDRMAREFTKLTFAAFSTTAILGALLTFLLVGLYPKFFGFLSGIFYPTMWGYAFLFFGETFALYLYWYSWDRLRTRKGWHLLLGLLLNLFGLAIMAIANSWGTFMMSPAGLDEAGRLVSLWAAVNNPTWMPINVHRLIANVSFGGALVAAYAGTKFLGARDAAARAHYDWMGYVGNFIATSALMVLPFAGYWLGREIYAFNQQMGITMMGGFLSWLWIIQAVLIGVLFLGSNYYLWLGMARIRGAERYRPYVKWLLLILTAGFLVWATPHSLVASLEEARRMGGAHHPVLGVLGVMSAKNTAVNLMILTTFLSLLLYRRANREAVVAWAAWGKAAQWLCLAAAAALVLFYGIYGYFVEAIVRIGFSVYQVLAVLATILLVTAIDLALFRKATSLGPIAWGHIAPRAQYVLVLLAVTFTWLMGLMGFARSAIRQHWHVYGVLRDTSPDAFTPALGYAANVVSVVTAVFLLLLVFIFWLAALGEEQAPVGRPADLPAGEH